MLLVRIVAANVVMASVLWWLAGDLSEWIEATTLERVGRCAICIIAGAGAYFATLLLLGARYADLAGHRPARL
jgi:putative peptidoglycan lipid II flippase